MRILLVLGIPGLAIIIVIAMLGMRQEPPKKERDDLDPLVAVTELVPMTANFEVRSQGTVRPLTETVLGAEVSGAITRISPKFVSGGVFQANERLPYESIVRSKEVDLGQFVSPGTRLGVVFATVITLFLIPSLYMLQVDLFARMRQFKGWLLSPSYSA